MLDKIWREIYLIKISQKLFNMCKIKNVKVLVLSELINMKSLIYNHNLILIKI